MIIAPKIIRNIGFVSTRFQGTDGVTLETEKWEEVLENMRYNCFFFAGQSNWKPDKTMVVEEAFFDHPEIKAMHREFFGVHKRANELTGKIHAFRQKLKAELYRFIKKFDIHMLIIENALAIPINIPFGLAITELIAETGMPAVAHHHDFYWERKRFMVNCVNDFINMSFPPSLKSITHVVINSEASKMLSYRRGISSVVIPNVFNYEKEAPGIDDYNKDVRKDLGLKKGDILFLQPTRVVQRKGIEHAIEVVHRLNNPKIKLVITHSAKDEGDAYYERVMEYAEILNVHLIIKPELFCIERCLTEDGRKRYSLWDVYPHADFITYPSTYEGFGNAFLEGVYFKIPILVNRYSIYQQDIEPIGFDVVAMNDFVTDDVLENIETILTNKERREQMVSKNFKLGRKYFSYDILQRELAEILLTYGQV
jgi:glycosyltransferase involved in cell wall biosynthesis